MYICINLYINIYVHIYAWKSAYKVICMRSLGKGRKKRKEGGSQIKKKRKKGDNTKKVCYIITFTHLCELHTYFCVKLCLCMCICEI